MPKFPSLFSYCPHCSTKLVELVDHEGVRRRKCADCEWIQYRNPTVGVAVILIHERRVLLGRRREGSWCIPCGHVEWDESIEVAAVREFEEETGLIVNLKSIFAVKSNFHDREHQTVGIWFLGQSSKGNLRAGDDLVQVEYFACDQLPELRFPTDQQVLEELRSSEVLGSG